ncbi:PAS domain-containing protein [Candidatus Saccharibacteria bacterium]|nr:PAS domain-containing protein [Candidatus Saccharibacteria bacterium]
MSLIKRLSKKKKTGDTQANLAEMVLRAIHDGVIMTDKKGVIEFINSAAAEMTGYGDNAIGLDYGLVVKLESKEGRELLPNENPLILAMNSGQPLESFQATLIVAHSNNRIPVSINVLIDEGVSKERIITFRNIAKELAEEGEQAEFISTASHEMRTPVAAIDGYLSLCLNPQTATIDERAKGYLAAAQTASKHLGKLFQDLLDVTKLDDNRICPNMEPVEMTDLVKGITDGYEQRAKELKIKLAFGSDSVSSFGENRLKQVTYGFVDTSFLREILDNLIDNALKYTPEGGSVYVNVRGDGDRVLINVTDTGIGISAEDLGHIFQKFYRVDNSDTRTIGGNGLGLYLVKQRAEAMGGKVWAESAFGEGSTFYVSLPRLTNDEYEKRMIVVRNAKLQPQPVAPTGPAVTTPPVAPVAQVASVAPVAPVAANSVASPPVAPAAPVAAKPTIPVAVPPASPAISAPVATSPPAVVPQVPSTTSQATNGTPNQPVQNQTNINLNGGEK